MIAVPLACFLTARGAIYLSVRIGHFTPLWPPTAILFVALLRNRAATWPILAGLAFIAEFSQAAFGTPWVPALGAAFADIVEPLVLAIALRRFANNESWYFSPGWMIRFGFFAVGAAATGAAIGSAWYKISTTIPFFFQWRLWTTADTLSMMIIAPFILCWSEPVLRKRLGRRRVVEAILLTGLVAAVSYYSFSGGLPLLFAAFPFLTLITLRAGLPGATAGCVALTAVAFGFTVNGLGPIARMPLATMETRVLIMQLYFLTAMLSIIPIAIFLTLREALAENLRNQHVISSAALNNMIQGLCMFDEQHRLITCNRRYAEIYRLPPALMEPGTPLQALLERQVTDGTFWGDPQDYVSAGLAEAGTLSPHQEAELPDGRIMEIHTRRLPDGAWVSTHEDITDRRRAGHRIAYLASHDPLTDLPNRAFFQEHLQRSIALAERGHGFALHSLDLDRFKAVNDTLGHAAGDDLLRQVAERLRKMTRDSDLVTRLGGDEFAIIQFPLETAKEAEMLAARMVEMLGKPYTVRGHEVVIGASVGIAMAPGDTLDAADLLQKSDLALYRAKAAGRNTYCFFEADMDTVLQARRVLETELRLAVQKGEFELHYQPILNLETGAISSLEALVRWRHPIRGLVGPADFIDVAEENGLIVPIGEWVLRQACRDAAGWPMDVRVSVNLSPAQFNKQNLVRLVTSALFAARLAPERLELEITETLVLQDSGSVLAILLELKELGVSIAMDDFGTGYSSLSYLRTFPFDRIKIDGSFARDVTTQEDCLAIVHATAQLSNKLGMQTTAEGVETIEQLEVMRAEGCTDIQGYYISRPVPVEQVPEVLIRYPRRPSSLVSKKAGQRNTPVSTFDDVDGEAA